MYLGHWEDGKMVTVNPVGNPGWPTDYATLSDVSSRAAYGARHAGACTTTLKAFFDESGCRNLLIHQTSSNRVGLVEIGWC